MEHRILILAMAKKDMLRKYEQSQKKVTKYSDQLKYLLDSDSSVRRRAGMRAKLSSECEERDRWHNRLVEIDNWILELRGK